MTRSVRLALAVVPLSLLAAWLFSPRRAAEEARAVMPVATQQALLPAGSDVSLGDVETPIRLAPKATEAQSTAVERTPQASPVAKIETTLVVEVADPSAVSNQRASVSLARPSGYPHRKRVNRSQHVEFDVEPGIELVLAVQAPPDGRAPFEHREPPLHAGERRAIRVELPPIQEVTYFVRVADASGALVSGAELRLGPVRALLWTSAPEDPQSLVVPEPVATTDADGYASVRTELLHGRALRVDAPGFAWRLTVIDEAHSTRHLAREVLLDVPASLWVVLGPVEREATHVDVTIYSGYFAPSDSLSSGRSLPDVHWTLRPDPDGVARFTDLPPRTSIELKVRTVEPSFLVEPPELQLVAGETRQIDLRRAAAARLLGSLRDPTAVPVEGAEVWLVPVRDARQGLFWAFEGRTARKAVTDSAGRFRFDEVIDGDWWIGPSAEGTLISDRTPLSVLDGAADRSLDLVVERGTWLQGRAVSSTARPITSGHVTAFRLDANEHFSADLDEQGGFSIGPLRDGDYEVVVFPREDNEESCGNSPRVEARAGNRDLVVVCPAAGRLLTVIDDVSEDPTFEASYLISYTLPNGIKQLAGLPLSKRGRTRRHDLDSGRYDVFVSTPDGRCALARGVLVDAQAEPTELHLQLHEGGRLRVRFDSVRTRPHITVLHGDAVVAGGSGRGLTTLEFTVPPGRVTVERMVYGKDGREIVARSADVIAGGDPVLVDFGSGD